jgi:DNA-nicking Smr family endonuclease
VLRQSVAKKRRGHGGPKGATEDEAVLPRAPERLASPFKGALAGLKKDLEEQAKKAAAKPAVPPPVLRAHALQPRKQKKLDEDDATALSLAMQGVKPLEGGKPGRVGTAPKVESRTARVAPFGRSSEDDARARLDALVAQDVRFRMQLDRDYVEAVRNDAPPRIVRELARRTRAPATLDLHGRTAREAQSEIVSFVRKAHKQGLDVLCIVHGKGQHSEGGQGVLRDVAIAALTETGAAPLVLAFVTAHDALGGSGALVVELKH